MTHVRPDIVALHALPDIQHGLSEQDCVCLPFPTLPSHLKTAFPFPPLQNCLSRVLSLSRSPFKIAFFTKTACFSSLPAKTAFLLKTATAFPLQGQLSRNTHLWRGCTRQQLVSGWQPDERWVPVQGWQHHLLSPGRLPSSAGRRGSGVAPPPCTHG